MGPRRLATPLELSSIKFVKISTEGKEGEALVGEHDIQAGEEELELDNSSDILFRTTHSTFVKGVLNGSRLTGGRRREAASTPLTCCGDRSKVADRMVEEGRSCESSARLYLCDGGLAGLFHFHLSLWAQRLQDLQPSQVAGPSLLPLVPSLLRLTESLLFALPLLLRSFNLLEALSSARRLLKDEIDQLFSVYEVLEEKEWKVEMLSVSRPSRCLRPTLTSALPSSSSPSGPSQVKQRRRGDELRQMWGRERK